MKTEIDPYQHGEKGIPMKRALVFGKRNFREILRDPLSLVFCFGLPLFMELLMSVINRSIPPEANMTVFHIGELAPGVIVFSFSFIALFGGLQIASDRSTAFLLRLYASPMTALDFLLGYILPLVPVALMQAAVCCIAGFFFGLKPTGGLLLMLLFSVFVSLLFIGLGVILGAAFTDKQVGGFASVLITVISISSGVWMDLDGIGGILLGICRALPFYHAKKILMAALAGGFAGAGLSFLVFAAYLLLVAVGAYGIFRFRMKLK